MPDANQLESLVGDLNEASGGDVGKGMVFELATSGNYKCIRMQEMDGTVWDDEDNNCEGYQIEDVRAHIILNLKQLGDNITDVIRKLT